MHLLTDLVVDRIDFVDEGANSAAFIEVFKRKERSGLMNFSEILSKLKPEHAEVIQQELEAAKNEVVKAKEDLATQSEELAKAKEEIEDLKKEKGTEEPPATPDEGDVDKSTGFDETEVLKSMPEAAREAFIKMRAQKEAAEEQVRKAAEEKAEAEAVAKANTLKSLPVEQSKLVEILKGCDTKVFDVLVAAAAAIDNTVLSEVGKSGQGTASKSAWDRIEAEADKVVERDSVTKQKAISIVLKEKPELYREYLDGGAE